MVSLDGMSVIAHAVVQETVSGGLFSKKKTTERRVMVIANANIGFNKDEHVAAAKSSPLNVPPPIVSLCEQQMLIAPYTLIVGGSDALAFAFWCARATFIIYC